MKLASAALLYAEHGFRVFPCEPRGKTPIAALAPRGVHSATTNRSRIAGWWHVQPAANIGVAMGGPCDVIDIDVDPERDIDGEREWAALIGRLIEQGPELSLEPWSVKTARGRHLWIAADPSAKNSTHKIARGVDTRAKGGYVIAPPSVHESGHLYEWIVAPPWWEVAGEH